MAHGTKVDIPTRSTPRFMTCSSMLSVAAGALWAITSGAANRAKPAISRIPIHRSLFLMICLLS